MQFHSLGNNMEQKHRMRMQKGEAAKPLSSPGAAGPGALEEAGPACLSPQPAGKAQHVATDVGRMREPMGFH